MYHTMYAPFIVVGGGLRFTPTTPQYPSCRRRHFGGAAAANQALGLSMGLPLLRMHRMDFVTWYSAGWAFCPGKGQD